MTLLRRLAGRLPRNWFARRRIMGELHRLSAVPCAVEVDDRGLSLPGALRRSLRRQVGRRLTAATLLVLVRAVEASHPSGTLQLALGPDPSGAG